MSDRRIVRMTCFGVVACFFVVTLILMATSHSPAQAQTTPTPAERKELLEVRQLVWESYLLNDQAKLKELIGEDFIITIKSRRVVPLSFPRTEVQDFGNVAILYSL